MVAIIALLILAMWYGLSQNINKLEKQISTLKKEVEKFQGLTTPKKETPSTTVSQQTVNETIATPRPVVPVNTPTVSQAISPTPKRTVSPSIPIIPSTPKPAKKEHREINYEKFIGENLFGKIGILILVLGIGFFVKYAIDNEWINETMRTVMGFAVGGGLLFTAQYLHKKYRTFSSLLAGGAFAIFYMTTAIAYHYYELFSQTGAFIILVMTTVFMSVLSFLYNRRELSIIALVGGFLAPFLTSSGEGTYMVFFTYMLVLDAGMFVLAILKQWKELPVISFFFTWFCMSLYLLGTLLPGNESIHLLLFATGFYLLFLLPIVFILKNNPQRMSKMLLVVLSTNNFIYMGIGIFLIASQKWTINALGLLTLFIALTNLITAICLKKVLADNKRLLFTLLGSAVTFVSITIPLQLEGSYITIFWAAEMVLLLWLFYKSEYRIYQYFSFALTLLTLISLQMDVNNAIDGKGMDAGIIFLNGTFITLLFSSVAYFVYALINRKYNAPVFENRLTRGIPIATIAIFVSAIIGWLAFDTEFRVHISDIRLSECIRMLFASFYILSICVLMKKKYSPDHYLTGYLIATCVNISLFFISYESLQSEWALPEFALFPWAMLIVVAAHMVLTARICYARYDFRSKKMEFFNISLCVVATLLLLVSTAVLLSQCTEGGNFSAGFSICLSLAGFILMLLGMRLHLRLFRAISLIMLGVVVAKLLLMDLWEMTTIGKIIVFIMLGVILLLLSFMYQKLKNILFKQDSDEK